MDECRMEGCGRPVFVEKHGVCVSCYSRMRRNGDVGGVRVCSAPNCDGRVVAKSLCGRHYSRLKRRGSIEDRTVGQRFHSKYVISSESGCWVWQDSDRSGYGFLHVDGRKRMAHRVGYELLVGPIPEGMQLDHLCRNKMCVNPAHAEPVTQHENILRSDNLAARWARRTVCHVCGGPFSVRKGVRFCLPCERDRHRRYLARKRAR